MTDVSPQTTTAEADALFEENRRKTKKALPSLLIVFTLGTLMLQAFNLVFQNIGDSLNMSSSASLISTLPGIVLGVVCMLYGTLCDFISPKRITIAGVTALVLGSLLGFFGASNFWIVLIARMIQVAGAQVEGSVFLVMAMKYLKDNEKAVYLGVFNAVYYLASAFGVFAGGFITSFDWKYLFLVPALSIFCVPFIVKNTPDISAKGEKMDYIGIIIFALFAALIAIYFSFPSVWYIVGIIALAAIFALWVAFSSHPFLSKSFITNGKFMSIVLLQFVYYFFNFACVPIYNIIGDKIYNMPLTTISLCLTIVYVVATIVGVFSGPLINKLGRTTTLAIASVMLVVGFAGSAIFITTSFWLLTALACIFIAGITAVYTPLYDAASYALPVDENGRGVGILDLVMNTSASIGMAVYSALMANPAMETKGLFGVDKGVAAATSNMFWIMATAALLALILFVIFRKSFKSNKQ
ncbi:MFS transporter, DHA2 family, metal-tetracycline-proton antiporter [Bifidobacterium commune]|uniref:MFS transporter, DHA2 family, metal-tetracycline-proton antiporter n=1 Tax=Bifidobacterium commune TaxID=1505727 RepID=A0A1C4H5P9_9BIFI|nr:MFS transporter [Bifidobacterium commune]SCC80113.1 MFS transporter, DHA2 family, metal-tetracycline-proton antiporter [Bifidobacterium commune]